jgi:hypothetical protein
MNIEFFGRCYVSVVEDYSLLKIVLNNLLLNFRHQLFFMAFTIFIYVTFLLIISLRINTFPVAIISGLFARQSEITGKSLILPNSILVWFGLDRLWLLIMDQHLSGVALLISMFILLSFFLPAIKETLTKDSILINNAQIISVIIIAIVIIYNGDFYWY